MALGKFAGRPAGGKPAPRRSRYAGIQAAQPRDPMPKPGDYRLRVVECEETTNPRSGSWFRAVLEVVITGHEDHPEGSKVAMIQSIDGRAATAGLPRVKAFVMNAAGFESEEDYDAFDPDGSFIDSLVGQVNKFSSGPDATTIVGRLVDCTVSRGKDICDTNGTPTGDFYREFAWSPVPDADQT